MIRQIFFFLLLATIAITTVSGQVKVKGYYRKDGTYVRPHYRSNPDGNPYNNWSYPGNTNPYTGKVATGNPSTYLANYYKTNKSYNKTYDSYNPVTFNNYYTLTNQTDYRGMLPYRDYSTSEGHAFYDSKRKFKLYDNFRTYIGYVKVSKSGQKFTVYDIDGNKISSNRSNTAFWALFYGAAITLVIYSGS